MKDFHREDDPRLRDHLDMQHAEGSFGTCILNVRQGLEICRRIV